VTDVRVLIVDDEPHARQTLRGLITHHPQLVLVGECRNGAEAVEGVRRLEPHLLLLDIQMPEMDGFAVLRALLPQCPPAVILVTAYDQFAVRAFEAEALDFLVKPFSDHRFHQAIHRACRRLAMHEAHELGRRLAAALERTAHPEPPSGKPPHRSHVVVSVGQRSMRVLTTAIAWLESDDSYTKLYVGGKSYLLRQPLSQLERELDPTAFIRVHRSAMVNVSHVRELRRGPARHCTVVLQDGTRLAVSERRRALVTRLFGGA
jgi:two-component system LytT family response regulator